MLTNTFYKLQKNIRYLRRGFTLVEVLLYIAIVAVIIFAIGTSVQAFLEARVKNQAIAEVNNQGGRAMQMILQAIRNATAINNFTSSSFNLTMPVAAQNPTCFQLTNSKIQMQEGTSGCAGTWIDLTDANKVTVAIISGSGDAGIFTNLSRTGTPGIIRARYNVTYVQPAGVNVYFQSYNKNFQGAASRR